MGLAVVDVDVGLWSKESRVCNWIGRRLRRRLGEGTQGRSKIGGGTQKYVAPLL